MADYVVTNLQSQTQPFASFISILTAGTLGACEPDAAGPRIMQLKTAAPCYNLSDFKGRSLVSKEVLRASTCAWMVTLVALVLASITSAQTTSGLLPDEPSLAANNSSSLPAAPRPSKQDQIDATNTCSLKHLAQCAKDVAQDQEGIWSMPFHMTTSDVVWFLPIAAATGVSLHYDAQALNTLGTNPSRESASNDFADAGFYGSLAGDAGLYFLGAATDNDHLSETGRLGAEAVADASLVTLGLKLVTNRQRPDEGNGQGQFWPNGTSSYEWDGSFPSEHAATMFALAHVISSEYPSKKVKIATYLLAMAVSASRVTGRDHVPSDVLVGGTIGYLVGGYVVDLHSSYSPGAALSVAPLVDQETQTYGLQVRLTPDSGNLRRVGSFVAQLARAR